MTDDPLTSCSTCEAPVQRVFHPGGGALQGLGLLQHRLRQEEVGGQLGDRGRAALRPRTRTRRRPPRRPSRRRRTPARARPAPPRARTSSPRAACGRRPAWTPSVTKRLVPLLQQVASSTSVSLELPVAMSANSAISWKPPMSVLSVLGAVQLTQGSRKNVLGDLIWSPIALSTSCWRAARSRSSSAGAHEFLRTRAKPSARRPSSSFSPFWKRRPLPEVVERRRADARLRLDRDPAERVDELREVLEVDLDEVVDLEPVAEERLDGLDRQRRAAERVGGVDLVDAVPRDVDLDVARDRELAHAAERGVDEHDRVGAPGPLVALVDRLAGALVRAEHEDRAAGEQVAARTTARARPSARRPAGLRR